MKKKLEQILLLALVAGSIGFLLNIAVVLRGYDAAGLPRRGFFLASALPFYCVIAALLPGALLFKFKGERKYLQTFTASIPAAAGIAVAALGLLIPSILGLISRPRGIALWRDIVGIVAGLALVPCAFCRWKGKRPVWLGWGVVTAYLVLMLIGNYAAWTRQAELNRFLYQLLAGAALMLTAYQQAAADAGIGNLKEYLVLSLMCVVLCPMAMAGSSQWPLYLAFLIYHVLNLLSLDLSKHKSSEGE